MRQNTIVCALHVLLQVMTGAVAETMLCEVGKHGDCGDPKRLIQRNTRMSSEFEMKHTKDDVQTSQTDHEDRSSSSQETASHWGTPAPAPLFRRVPQGPLFCTIEMEAICEDGTSDSACEIHAHGRVRQCPCHKPWTCNVCPHGKETNCCHAEERECKEFELQLPSRPVKYERAQIPQGPYFCTPTPFAKCEDGKYSQQCDDNQVEYGEGEFKRKKNGDPYWAKDTFDVRVLECPCHSPYKCTPCEKGNNCCAPSKEACRSKGKKVLVYYGTRPTPQPTPSPPLLYSHDNPTHKLEKCEGDCDDDSDCQEGLLCFERKGFTQVPGCFGEGTKNGDYCFKSSDSQFPLLKYIADNVDDGTLEECEGDCDADDDCKEGLVCYERSKGEFIPGCSGRGLEAPSNKKSDYCCNPKNAGC